MNQNKIQNHSKKVNNGYSSGGCETQKLSGEWAKYTQAGFAIKCLNSNDIPIYLREMIPETVFTTRRQPRIGKFFNNAKGKIGKQRIHNWLKFMEEIKDDWLGMNLMIGAIRTLLKRTLFHHSRD